MSCFYFDGQITLECTLHVTDEYLYINFADRPDKNIIWNRAKIGEFKLTGNNLIIKYGGSSQQTIECNNNTSRDIYKKLSETNTSKKAKHSGSKSVAVIGIGFCLIIVAICVGIYMIALPWVGEKSAALIPKSTEIELGNSLAESTLQTSTKEDSATYYANLFVSKLKTNSAYPIQITVVKSDEINAFALPGGHIFVYSSIIKNMDTYEEFTGLVGHEISHVTDQHSLKSICRSAASSLFIACLFGDVTGISAGILEQADQFKQLDYSRDLETIADDKGYELMLQNKISPKGMIDLLNLLQKESTEMPGFMKYLSTHPETAERIKNIESKKEVKVSFTENPELKLLFGKMKSQLD